MKSALLRSPVVAWALSDWANSAFATTIMAGFFPVFFKQFWSVGVDPDVSTFRLGMTNGLSSLGRCGCPVSYRGIRAVTNANGCKMAANEA